MEDSAAGMVGVLKRVDSGLKAYIVLLGTQINVEAERQTSVDTSVDTGGDAPVAEAA